MNVAELEEKLKQFNLPIPWLIKSSHSLRSDDLAVCSSRYV